MLSKKWEYQIHSSTFLSKYSTMGSPKSEARGEVICTWFDHEDGS